MCRQSLLKRHVHPLATRASACRRADELCDSNRARAQGPSPPRADARADSLGGALSSGGHATDTARARDRPDSLRSWRRRAPAGSHRVRCVARSDATSCLLDSRVSHRAGEQSPFPRSGQLSEAGGGGEWSIPWCASSRIGSQLCDRCDGRGKPGGTQGGRL